MDCWALAEALLSVIFPCIAHLVYLTKVVVYIEGSSSHQQELDQLVDNGQLPLHHSYMESSVMNEKKS